MSIGYPIVVPAPNEPVGGLEREYKIRMRDKARTIEGDA